MDHFNDFVPIRTADRQAFFTPTCFSTVSMATATGFHTWRKPRGCSMVHIFFWGSGGGGGGGRTGGSGTNRSGGGGGGSAAGIKILLDAWQLPDILHFVLGQGGRGGAASTDGTKGCLSGIFFAPMSQTGAIGVLTEQITGGAQGIAGGAGVAGTGGAGGTSANNQLLRGQGLSQGVNSLLSTAGSDGGATLAGAPGTTSSNSPFWSGGGGSAVNSGGTATSGVRTPANPFIAPWVAPDGGISGGLTDGGDFYLPPGQLWMPMVGGSGAGGPNGSGVGGKGGNSGSGCGGAGGGGGVTGGAGGHGGDAGAIITSW